MTSTFGQLLPWPNSIERLLPAEPLNTIYCCTLRASISPPVSSSSRALSLRLSFSSDVPRRRYDFLLRLQIYKVDHVTAGSFVSFVVKSSSFNILSCFAFRPKRAVSVSLFSRQMQHSYDNGKCNIQILTYV